MSARILDGKRIADALIEVLRSQIAVRALVHPDWR